MATAQHDDELDICWFARGNSISLRWVWVTLNIWVILSLLFLIATSVYVGVILSNERRDLMTFITHQTPAATAAVAFGSVAGGEHAKLADGTRMTSFSLPPMNAIVRHSQPVAPGSAAHYYYYNRSGYVADTTTPAMSSRKVGNSAVNMFGGRSTPLASRESLGLTQANGNSGAGTAANGVTRKSKPAPLSIYPASHPVALAHEALHGRRPAASRDSVLETEYMQTSGSAIAAHRTAQQHGLNYSDIPLRSGGTSSSGRNSVCGSCKRASLSSHGSGAVHSVRTHRHHSEIITAARYYSLSKQQWGSMGESRPGSIANKQPHRPASSGFMYMSGLANDSESSRISAAHPWDSSRRLIHKPSYASTTAAAAAAQKASPLAAELRPPYGVYAQKSVALINSRSVSAGVAAHRQGRMAKHMSMPVPSGVAESYVVEPETSDSGTAVRIAPRHVRQLSMPPNTSQQQLAAKPGAEAAIPTGCHHGWWHISQQSNVSLASGLVAKPPSAHLGGAAKVPAGLGPTARSNNLKPGGNKPDKPTLSAAAEAVRPQRLLERGHMWLTGGKPERQRGKGGEVQSQMQRIERRVRMLVATGALRVATRAMVPLVTQLCMVVWSTMHSVNASMSSQSSVYAAAILLLSTQGILDMALYHIFDTQSDTSDISLASVVPLSSYNNSGSSGSGGKAPAASCHALHSAHHHYHYHQPSLVHLQGDVVYTPRASHDRPPSSSWHDPYHHNRQQQQQQQPIKNHLGHHHHHQNPLPHQRSISLTSVESGGEQRFVFNVDSLNIRRADRTSNAMQSDTLHDGSDCVAWSHMDGLSAHDARCSSQFSAPHGTQQHRYPVLSGWEETDMEEFPSPPAAARPPHMD
ncbi:hypothetical protein GGI04_002237 [Coemansia thaxteri]|nr:hypothetical protein GGI04_002237 [Coemansia thaxteri]